MKLNSIQHSPSFGQLRMQPQTIEYLRDCTLKEQDEIDKAGELIAKTEYYHIDMDENGDRTIVSPFANQYVGGTFDVKRPTDEFLCYSAKWAGRENASLKKGSIASFCIKFESVEAASKAYEEISKSSGITRDAIMVKHLDKATRREAERNKQAREKVRAQQDNAEILLSKYLCVEKK